MNTFWIQFVIKIWKKMLLIRVLFLEAFPLLKELPEVLRLHANVIFFSNSHSVSLLPGWQHKLRIQGESNYNETIRRLNDSMKKMGRENDGMKSTGYREEGKTQKHIAWQGEQSHKENRARRREWNNKDRQWGLVTGGKVCTNTQTRVLITALISMKLVFLSNNCVH